MNMPKRVQDTNKQHFSCFELLSRVHVVPSPCSLLLHTQRTLIGPFHSASRVKMIPEVCIFVFMKDSPGGVMELSTDVWNTCANISS